MEDESWQLDALRRSLTARDRYLRVVTAAHGLEAQRQLEGRVDLVLTDLRMPEMDGFQLLEWLAANRPELPVFVMTAELNEATADRVRAIADVPCFAKPLDVADMLRRFRRTLGREDSDV